jgi:hypothetical protein
MLQKPQGLLINFCTNNVQNQSNHCKTNIYGNKKTKTLNA